MPDILSSLPVEYLFTIHAVVAAPVPIPGGPTGTRVIVNVTGGTFQGPKVSGTVGMGGDWLSMRTTGSAHLDVRLLLITDDGVAIHMAYEGIMAPSDTGVRIITAPLFQTGDERYAWLNDVQAVAIGKPSKDAVDYDVYRIL
jgi:Protein of unknown function (DUF3237)